LLLVVHSFALEPLSLLDIADFERDELRP